MSKTATKKSTSKSDSVGIAELKAHLSARIKAVERGEVLIVLDRARPVARIVPYEAAQPSLIVREANGRPGDLRLPKLKKQTHKVTSVDLLLEDRWSGR
jgi:prevent-host-death family protein